MTASLQNILIYMSPRCGGMVVMTMVALVLGSIVGMGMGILGYHRMSTGQSPCVVGTPGSVAIGIALLWFLMTFGVVKGIAWVLQRLG